MTEVADPRVTRVTVQLLHLREINSVSSGAAGEVASLSARFPSSEQVKEEKK